MIKYLIHLVLAVSLFFLHLVGYAQSKTSTVDHFDKVIVSPHVKVTFKEGATETVTVENARLPQEKINIEVEDKTLRIYLDGAKMVTKNEKYKSNQWKSKRPLYKGTMITVTVTYKDIKELSIRGEEEIICQSPIEREDFELSIYGESRMTMNALKVNSLQVSIYGESYLEVKEGKVNNQKYTVYGEGKVNTTGMSNEKTKITAYGEANFRVNVSDHLKVTAFGEAIVAYNGNPSVSKGIIIGNATIQKMN